MLELTVLCVAYCYFFGSTMGESPTGTEEESALSIVPNASASVSNPRSSTSLRLLSTDAEVPPPSVLQFMGDVCKVWDIWGTLAPTGGGSTGQQLLSGQQDYSNPI